VTVIIPAYNEERVIEASVHRILASDYPELDVIVADDGSKDRTSAIVAQAFGQEPRVRLMTLTNGGKASALNRALAAADGEIIVALDADTQFEPQTIGKLVRWFEKPEIGAVAGNAKVGNRVNLVTRWQAVEYVTAQNIERRALTRFDAIMVVPGAVGAWRREALNDVGGYPEDTLAEDQDLTIAIQREGWKIAYDEDAVAWTEAPETLRALGKQRFRWAFGTLQCLWKHRVIMARQRPSGLAFVGMPQAWLFQIAFAIASPLIDLALGISIVGTIVRVLQHGWAQTETDVLRMGAYWLGFTLIDLACGLVAFRLDVREKRLPALLLLSQRFVYRQLMYGVVIRAVSAALAGLGIGWGKLERTGRVSTPGAGAGTGGRPGADRAPPTVQGPAQGRSGGLLHRRTKARVRRAEVEFLHLAAQHRGIAGHADTGCSGFLGHGGVVLGGLFQPLHGAVDLVDAGGLALRTLGNGDHQRPQFLHLIRDMAQPVLDIGDQPHPGLHLCHRGHDLGFHVLGGTGAAQGQRAHFVCHHGKSAPGFACTGGLDPGVQRQQVGLEGNPVDQRDDLADVFRGLGDGLHRFDRLFHHDARS
jgi:GT2 family glycosyltransferase